MRIFETHAHYDDAAYDEDRSELLDGKLKEAGIEYVVNIAADMRSVSTTDELTKKYDYIYGALGIHPEAVQNLTEGDMEIIRSKTVNNEKIRAIGEIGFDFSDGYPEQDVQEKWFRRQIALAKELKKPIVVHSRDAAEDTYRVLKSEYEKKEGQVNGVIHCFSYSANEALKYTELGFVIGVGGVVTFKNGRKLKETVQQIPLEKIVLETDSPYLSPEPFRGRRNSSLNLQYIIKMIAGLKNVSEDEVCETTMKNAVRLYGLE